MISNIEKELLNIKYAVLEFGVFICGLILLDIFIHVGQIIVLIGAVTLFVLAVVISVVSYFKMKQFDIKFED
jgi:hypothetical protein